MTSPTYVNSAARLIKYAMKDAGLLAKGQEPSSLDYAENMNRLNDLINTWQLTGIKLFLLQDISVTPVVGTQTYTFGPGGEVDMTKPLRIIDAYYTDASAVNRPLTSIAYQDWNRLSARTEVGSTNQYFVDKRVATLEVSVWPSPDTNTALGTFHFICQTQATNFVSITDTMAFPSEWAMALRWGLADEICTGQPQAIVQRCGMRAAQFKEILEDWDVEDVSVFFSPDSRGSSGDFR
jgi:hypothetical protein